MLPILPLDRLLPVELEHHLVDQLDGLKPKPLPRSPHFAMGNRENLTQDRFHGLFPPRHLCRLQLRQSDRDQSFSFV